MLTVRLLILPAILLICGSVHVSAQQQQSFPYPATIALDDVEVRCGPGQRYYVTSRLQAGTRITVHRHDHGGWFMIAPPPGSFSWISADHVSVQGERGTVRLDPTPEGLPARAIVRIGSELSDDHAFYGRELSDGDEVRILGKKMLQTERGAREMLRIQPPAQEFRWIKGDFVVPVDAAVRQQQANDPFQIPPQHRPRLTEEDLIVAAETRPATAKAQKIAELETRLARADQQYAEMMALSPRDWNLESMEQEYQTLLADADSEVAAKIDQRLRVLESRRSVYQQFQRFQQITTQASMRDAQLASMMSGGNVAYGHWIAEEAKPTPSQLAAAGGMLGEGDVQPRLNGAGIVQPIGIAGMPPYALVAPDGRFLAYLEPSDARQLQEWVGKEAGIIGQRQFEPQYNADLIRVRRITAVQLVK